MSGFLLFFLPFTVVLSSVFPGLFDSTMMSRLALYPLAGAVILFFGRKSISRTHMIVGALIGLLPALSLLWGTSIVGGIPFAVRWISFGMMILGFSGTIARWGLKSHLAGLVAAAVITSMVMIAAGADTITGNANRAGMVLALGFVGSLILFNKKRLYSWLASSLIITGVLLSSFYIGWIACLAAGSVYFLWARWKIRTWMILTLMIVGQIIFAAFPQYAARTGPTLELRTRIWRYSAMLFKENIPLGVGIGSARLKIFNGAEPELRILAGGNKRIDYLHSEPLTMISELGIPGLLLLLFMLYWFTKKCKSVEQLALLTAFWPIFTSDLPLATPLGAIPAALFLGAIPSLRENRISVPVFLPVLALILSMYWFFMVVTGYSAMGNAERRSVTNIELACERIPWEERVFLVAGQIHLQNDMTLSALEDSRHFIDLYPDYFRGWELRATALAAAGRESSSSSAWAKAALLVPDNIVYPDRYFYALNAIQPGMNPDTAIAISSVLIESRDSIKLLITGIDSAQSLFIISKLLDLSDQCRPLSSYHAAQIWFMAISHAVYTEDHLPSDLSMRILEAEDDLYQFLDPDWTMKADDFIQALKN